MANRERWKKLIDEMKTSGMSKEEFADSRGLSRHSVHHWYYKFKREEAEGKNGRPNGSSATIPVPTIQPGGAPLPIKARKDLFVPTRAPQPEDEVEDVDDRLDEEPNTAALVPVAPTPRVRVPRSGPDVSSGTRIDMLEIVFPSGAKLRFPAGTDPAYVRSLL